MRRRDGGQAAERVARAENALLRDILERLWESFRAGDIVVRGPAFGAMQRVKNVLGDPPPPAMDGGNDEAR